MLASDKSIPEDAPGARLDREIESLQLQISSLKSQRALQTTAILSSQTSQSVLQRLQRAAPSKPNPTTTNSLPHDADPLHAILQAKSTAQAAHNQECLYRACASITTFRIRDPDPNAVDSGHVQGIRIDVGSAGKFVRPYYIMLNKPWAGSGLLRIHRHTVPPYIPLESLAARYLPSPKVSGDVVKAKRQDLSRFVRGLRRELLGYHNRISVIKELRRAFGLDEKMPRKGKGRERVIVDVSAADAEVKQIRIEWVDGRIGRCIVGPKGEVLKCVVIGEDGRDRETERRVVGGGGRMEGIADRLKEGIY